AGARVIGASRPTGRKRGGDNSRNTHCGSLFRAILASALCTVQHQIPFSNAAMSPHPDHGSGDDAVS
ncbi:hypothetical protein ACFXOQ_37175, partial [Streptomyces californicus]|uniref:hypothetical protein n=1 Tax=Streptomyces californicus TaxID=67351 RepID=UPI0036923A04